MVKSLQIFLISSSDMPDILLGVIATFLYTFYEHIFCEDAGSTDQMQASAPLNFSLTLLGYSDPISSKTTVLSLSALGAPSGTLTSRRANATISLTLGFCKANFRHSWPTKPVAPVRINFMSDCVVRVMIDVLEMTAIPKSTP